MMKQWQRTHIFTTACEKMCFFECIYHNIYYNSKTDGHSFLKKPVNALVLMVGKGKPGLFGAWLGQSAKNTFSEEPSTLS